MLRLSPIRVTAILLMACFLVSLSGSVFFYQTTPDITEPFLTVLVSFFGMSVGVSVWVTLFVIAIAALGYVVVNSLAMIKGISGDVGRFYSKLWFNPLNVIVRPEFLSPKGLEARAKLLKCIVIFISVGIALSVVNYVFRKAY